MTHISKLLFACFFFMAVLSSGRLNAAEIWVSPTGSDNNPGTREKPVQGIDVALRKARELRRLADPSIQNGIFIILRGGVYTLVESLFIRPEDSGTAASPTVFKAAEGEFPVISGGRRIGGWKKAGNIAGLPAKAKGKVWVAEAPLVWDNVMDFRQLWVNNTKTVRARESNPGKMNRILSWNHKDQTCQIPKPAVDISKTPGLEMFIHQWWAIAVLRVKSAQVKGDSVKLSFLQPESRVQSEHPWPAPWISSKTGNSAFYLTNAIQFLDQPGEWFLDKKNRKVYYWPRSTENMNAAKVIAPELETLVRMEGTIDNPVSHVFFRGIGFQHTGWLRPSRAGHVPLQAGMYMLDAYKLKIPGTPDKKGLENQAWLGRPASAVEVSFANNTGFEGCRFEHLASSGLDYKRATNNDLIKANLFKDIGGTGIQVGVYSDESFEAHLPYNPDDLREVCRNTTITNNLITDVTNEDWGCLGISAGFVKGINITHNEISEVSYSGIAMGWGWTKTVNVMSNNRISGNKISLYAKHMYDVAGIYTLSAQPGSVITENYIDSIYKAPYAHDPHHWFYLYTDEGSSYFTINNNWCPAEKFLQNANGPGNTWQNNGPQVADSVKHAAGLEPAYHYLLKEKVGNRDSWNINKYEPENDLDKGNPQVVLEITAPGSTALDSTALFAVCRENKIPLKQVYSWKNHFVIFGSLDEPLKLQQQLQQKLPGAAVKFYDHAFYEFNRKKHCKTEETAKEWDHIILSANLVEDARLQKEYLDYHATQFEKWPEVSKGFCNADFQQLLVFRNGRQLMLIISIPHGKSLAELDPKTTANNPRVTDWNNRMKKYQEGIPGTEKGQVWVLFEGNRK